MNKSSTRFFANSFGLRILPNIILCLSLGFLGSLFFKNAYLEIKLLENEDVFFQAAKLVLGLSFMAGFILKRYLQGIRALYLEYSVLFLLIVEMITLNGFSSGILQVDYIFYTDLFLFFASLNALVTGMLGARLKNFRLWGFLAGGTSYIIYAYFNSEIVKIQSSELGVQNIKNKNGRQYFADVFVCNSDVSSTSLICNNCVR
jgi:hypothetical protein